MLGPTYSKLVNKIWILSLPEVSKTYFLLKYNKNFEIENLYKRNCKDPYVHCYPLKIFNSNVHVLIKLPFISKGETIRRTKNNVTVIL